MKILLLFSCAIMTSFSSLRTLKRGDSSSLRCWRRCPSGRGVGCGGVNPSLGHAHLCEDRPWSSACHRGRRGEGELWFPV